MATRCWALNEDGKRCELPAGHDDLHEISQTWSDEECYVPTTSGQIYATTYIPNASENIVPERKQVTLCVACNHPHRGAECKCGCYEFIG